MKNLKSLLSAVALLFICVAANATVKPIADKPTKDDVINVYIDAIAHGKPAGLANLVSDDLQFNIQRGENVTTLDKGKFMDYVKSGANSDAPASTTSTIVQEDENTYVVKVDFKYGDLTRTDVITLQNSNGWTVTNVVSSFKK
jgi:Putative lumazine-binding